MRRVPLVMLLVFGALVVPGVARAVDLDQAVCQSWGGFWTTGTCTVDGDDIPDSTDVTVGAGVTLTIVGGSPLGGTWVVDAGGTLRMQEYAHLLVVGSLTNAGSLVLESTSFLTTPSLETSGTIEGGGTLRADLENTGTITVVRWLTFGGASTNHGTIDVPIVDVYDTISSPTVDNYSVVTTEDLDFAGPSAFPGSWVNHCGSTFTATAVDDPTRITDFHCFADVPESHPFFTEIEWMAAQGITTGYPDGTYRPATDVTRMAMSAFMYRLAGEPAFTPPGTPTFTDVPDTHPFYAEIEWMAAESISTGYADGTYRPATDVTRQAMSAFMYRLAGADDPPFPPPVTPTFTDVPVTHPFYEQIEWMTAEGISTGYADDTYRPATDVTRMAMSAFMNRLAPLLP